MNKSPKVVIIMRDDTGRPNIITASSLPPAEVIQTARGPAVPSRPLNVFAELVPELSPPTSPYNITPVMVQIAPNKPKSVIATPINSLSALIEFTAPRNRGGIAIIEYTVTSLPGNIIATGTSSPITINGLSQNIPYTFTVHATNAVGNSPESAASNSLVL
jgi:Fibronectin type III domain